MHLKLRKPNVQGLKYGQAPYVLENVKKNVDVSTFNMSMSNYLRLLQDYIYY